MEFASSLQAAVRGDYQAYMIGWSGRVDIDGNTYQFLHSNQANNNGNYASTEVDKLLEQARGLTDPAKRRDLYAQMWPILREDMPFTYLWNARNIVAMTTKLNGFRAVPDGMIRIQGMELAK
jgi:peptide/nickel transport system substrate-binding protein